jgi:hypothetical protein
MCSLVKPRFPQKAHVRGFGFLVMSPRDKQTDEHYSEQETRRRVEATLRAAFSTPAKPQSEMKLGKPRGKPKKSPTKQKSKK